MYRRLIFILSVCLLIVCIFSVDSLFGVGGKAIKTSQFLMLPIIKQ